METNITKTSDQVKTNEKKKIVVKRKVAGVTLPKKTSITSAPEQLEEPLQQSDKDKNTDFVLQTMLTCIIYLTL